MRVVHMLAIICAMLTVFCLGAESQHPPQSFVTSRWTMLSIVFASLALVLSLLDLLP